ncbi:MAG: metallophosphoesterase family protein, partial [Anaerolineae bacterium]
TMRYLVISDIHANLPAFDAVLADANGQYDRMWCLGDVVGYGPHPNECIDRLNEYDHLCIAGNHDWATLDKLDVEEFNTNARFAALWTRDRLTAANKDYLDGLPLHLLKEEVFTLVHGSPRHPIWEYILYPKIAQVNFEHFETTYCLVGHTHSPMVFAQAADPNAMCEAIIPEPDLHRQKLNTRRLIINPGSVGQPRDGDARAAYGLLDTATMEFTIKRVAYPIADVQEVMKDYSFPPKLWNRLAFGY